MESTVLFLAIVALLLVLVWAVVELALTLRSSRKAVNHAVEKIDGTLDDVSSVLSDAQPVIQRLDGITEELEPASARVEPLLDKVGTAVDALSVDLVRVDDILTDVSTVTSTGASVSDAVTKATNAAADGLVGLAHRITGKQHASSDEPAQLAAPEDSDSQVENAETTPTEAAKHERGERVYITYPVDAAPQDKNEAPQNTAEKNEDNAAAEN